MEEKQRSHMIQPSHCWMVSTGTEIRMEERHPHPHVYRSDMGFGVSFGNLQWMNG